MTGFEPDADINVSDFGVTTSSDECSQVAANALHQGDTGRLQLSPNDASLQLLVESWPKLPLPAQDSVLAIVKAFLPMLATGIANTKLGDRYLRLSWSLAKQCRNVVQGCLREEEWLDVDEEFFQIICAALAEYHR